MGTRSLVAIQDGNTEILTLYRQFDGYPTGMGADLKEVANKTIINGISGQTSETHANGMQCLAAQIVAGLKDSIGNVYVKVPGARDCGEEFLYTVFLHNDVVHLRVNDGEMTAFGLPGTPEPDMGTLYNGPIADFDPEKCDEAATA